MEEDTSNDQKEDGENIDIWKGRRTGTKNAVLTATAGA